MVIAKVEAYATLTPQFQAIQLKLHELKKSTGAQLQQTKAGLEPLLSDCKKSVKKVASTAESN